MSSHDAWKITEPGFSIDHIDTYETLFALANGNLGLRGDFDEKYPAFHKGTYINGFFEKEPITYGEIAYGYAENHETILNIPNAKYIALFVDGEEFRLDAIEPSRIEDYQRYLDIRNGVLVRIVRVRLSSNVLIEIRSTRLVSFLRESIAAIKYEVCLLETPNRWPSVVRLESCIEGRVFNRRAEGDPRVGSKFQRDAYAIDRLEYDNSEARILITTQLSRLAATAQIRHVFSGPRSMQVETAIEGSTVIHGWNGRVEAGQKFSLVKYMAYQMAALEDAGSCWAEAHQELIRASQDGFEVLFNEQRSFLSEFWERADVVVEGDSKVQQALRFNLFHVLQSTGRKGKTGLAAKGLTGEGYEGHYFWDTEIYVLPFLIYTMPEIAQKLLEYRYSILDKARQRAKIMSEKGALFPWRTIDGEEVSAYYPAGTAQYHINADIIYAMEKYCKASDDIEFLYGPVAEVAAETARLWISLGHYSEDKRFRIDEVTGPDEYTVLVDNNCYTNLMAKNNLAFAARVLKEMQENRSEAFEALRKKIGLLDSEIGFWESAAEAMYIPYDKKTGIYAQDDSFFEKERWPFDETPADRYPLLLHYHPLVIYRHQVLKQPDLVLAQFLLSEKFSLAEKKRNFKFYEPLTTGDSSLSHCIQSIMASETGDAKAALDYFMKTVRMDLDDVHGNSRDGIHTAAMGGSWLSVVYGFAGFRDRASAGDEALFDSQAAAVDEAPSADRAVADVKAYYSFNPRLPEGWQRLSFSLQLGIQRLDIDIKKDRVRYARETEFQARVQPSSEASREALAFKHKKELIVLKPGESVEISLKPVFRAAIFDLDGVVTDTARYHFQAWKKLCEEHGWQVDEALNEKLKGVGRMESLDIILKENAIDLPASQKIELAERKNSYYKEFLTRLTPEDILPGMKSLLLELGNHGIKRVLASASRNAPTIIERLGLGPIPGQFFDALADPNAVTCGKPDPELFLLAADLAGASPEDCVGIEDAQAGIIAIKAAGMKALGVGEGLTGADIVVESTSEISFQMLESLFRSKS